MGDTPSSSQSTTAPQRPTGSLRAPSASDTLTGRRAQLAKVIPRRRRVAWWLGIVLAFGFAVLVVPAITADRWLTALGAGMVVEDQPATVTLRVPPFAGFNTPDRYIGNGGIVIARGQIARSKDVANAAAIEVALPRGPLPYVAFFLLTFVLAAIFTHHMRRSTRGRLVRVQVVSLVLIVLLGAAVKVLLLTTAASALVVPVALLALVPTMALDRIVGLATGILAALTISLLGPFDVGVAILMLVQASVAGLVVAEQPKQRWRAALTAGVVTTVFTAATYFLLTYLTTGHLLMIRDPLWLAAAVGPAIATVLAVPLLPLYQLLVGEITRGRLIELEDLSNPLLHQIATRAPGTWQHSLMMANLAEVAANAIGANGRLVRVGAYYHDLGKSLQPKYFIENLDPGETSPHDQLPPEVSCDAIFAHVTEGIVTARKAGLHERIVDFMHMHHGNGVLEYFWGKAREQGNPNDLTVEDFRYPGHPPQSRETAILAICDAVEAASRTLKKPDAASIDSLVQRIVYGKLHLGQLDESGLSMSDLRRVNDSLRETIRHANHGRIEYPWQKAAQDASAAADPVTSTAPRLDSLDRPAKVEPARPVGESGRIAAESKESIALDQTADIRQPPTLDPAIVATAPAAVPEMRDSERPAKRDSDRPAKRDSDRPAKRDSDRPARREDEPRAREPSRLPPVVNDPEPPSLAVSAAPHVAAPDLITPSTFAAEPRAARKRAATLPPIEPRRAPTVPPPMSGRRSPTIPPTISPTLRREPTSPPPGLERAPSGIPLGRRRPTTAPPMVGRRPSTSPPLAGRREPTSPPFAPRREPTSPPPLTSGPPDHPPPGGRTAGPPPPVDLENAVTNPPPLRGQASTPPPVRKQALIIEDDPASSLRITAERCAVDDPESSPLDLGPGATHRSLPAQPWDDAPESIDETRPRLQLPIPSPPVSYPGVSLPVAKPAGSGDLADLANRVDAAMTDEWSPETPVKPPSRAELRSLLGKPDPTRLQSIEEIEALHLAAMDEPSDPEILRPRTRANPAPTAEVDPEDIEAAIELAPPARRPHTVGVAKPKTPK